MKSVHSSSPFRFVLSSRYLMTRRIIRKTLIALYTEPRSAAHSVNGQNRLGIPAVVPALGLRSGQARVGIQISPPGFRVAACGPVSSMGQARSEYGERMTGDLFFQNGTYFQSTYPRHFKVKDDDVYGILANHI